MEYRCLMCRRESLGEICKLCRELVAHKVWMDSRIAVYCRACHDIYPLPDIVFDTIYPRLRGITGFLVLIFGPDGCLKCQPSKLDRRYDLFRASAPSDTNPVQKN